MFFIKYNIFLLFTNFCFSQNVINNSFNFEYYPNNRFIIKSDTTSNDRYLKAITGKYNINIDTIVFSCFDGTFEHFQIEQKVKLSFINNQNDKKINVEVKNIPIVKIFEEMPFYYSLFDTIKYSVDDKIYYHILDKKLLKNQWQLNKPNKKFILKLNFCKYQERMNIYSNIFEINPDFINTIEIDYYYIYSNVMLEELINDLPKQINYKGKKYYTKYLTT